MCFALFGSLTIVVKLQTDFCKVTDTFKTVCKKVVARILKPLHMSDGIRKVARFWCEEVFEVIRVGGPV